MAGDTLGNDGSTGQLKVDIKAIVDNIDQRLVGQRIKAVADGVAKNYDLGFGSKLDADVLNSFSPTERVVFEPYLDLRNTEDQTDLTELIELIEGTYGNFSQPTNFDLRRFEPGSRVRNENYQGPQWKSIEDFFGVKAGLLYVQSTIETKGVLNTSRIEYSVNRNLLTHENMEYLNTKNEANKDQPILKDGVTYYTQDGDQRTIFLATNYPSVHLELKEKQNEKGEYGFRVYFHPEEQK